MQRAQTAVTGFTAIVTAFSLVQAQINLANIQKLVGTEADPDEPARSPADPLRRS